MFLSCAPTLLCFLGSYIQVTAQWIVHMITNRYFNHNTFKQNSWFLPVKPTLSACIKILRYSWLPSCSNPTSTLPSKYTPVPDVTGQHLQCFPSGPRLPHLYWSCSSPLTCLSSVTWVFQLLFIEQPQERVENISYSKWSVNIQYTQNSPQVIFLFTVSIFPVITVYNFYNLKNNLVLYFCFVRDKTF